MYVSAVAWPVAAAAPRRCKAWRGCGVVWYGVACRGVAAVVVEGVQVADGGGKGKYTLAVVTVVEVAAKHVGGVGGG